MKKIILLSVMVMLQTSLYHLNSQQSAKKEQSPKQIEVKINRNIEFMGFVLHMGWLGPDLETSNPPVKTGSKTVNEKEWRAYGFSTYLKYKKFSQSTYLKTIVSIGYNLDYSPIMDLMLVVDTFPHAHLNNRVSDQTLKGFSADRDISNGKKIAEQLLEALNSFYREVDFDKYLKESRGYYDKMIAQVNAAKMNDNFINTMESFYRQQYKSYTLVPSLLIPTGMGFGPRIGSGSSMKIYNIFGPLEAQILKDDSIDLGFNNKRRLMELSVHEFGHSFVNPLINTIPDSLIQGTAHLFSKIEDSMTSQGYSTWKTCLTEHFVRAGEVVIARAMGLDENAEDLRKWYVNDRKFIYLPVIIDELGKYRKGQYKSYQETVVGTMALLKDVRD